MSKTPVHPVAPLDGADQEANDQTLLPPLRQQLSTARHALSVLVGRFPGEWSAPDFELTEIQLPAELPISLPSELARQRPDILAAEAELHAASAAVGIAVAQTYPSITLAASTGFESVSIDTLFQGSSQIWSVVSGLSAPIFHGGALEAQKQAAIDAFQASAAWTSRSGVSTPRSGCGRSTGIGQLRVCHRSLLDGACRRRRAATLFDNRQWNGLCDAHHLRVLTFALPAGWLPGLNQPPGYGVSADKDFSMPRRWRLQWGDGCRQARSDRRHLRDPRDQRNNSLPVPQ